MAPDARRPFLHAVPELPPSTLVLPASESTDWLQTNRQDLRATFADVDPMVSPQRAVVLPACLALMVCCAAVVPLPSSVTAPREMPTEFITAPVVRGPLEQTLAERGLLDSQESFIVASECEWTVRIVRLIPEGECVKEGDVVVELDSSELEEKLRDREIRIINAAADLNQAREDLHLLRLENESSVAQAKLAHQLADLDLECYLEGEFPKQRMEAEAAVAVAEEDLTRAEESYDYTLRMARKGYQSPSDAEKTRLSLLKQEHVLDNARRELEVLTRHTYPREVAQLQGTAVEAEHQLARIHQQAETALISQEVLVGNRQTQYQQHVDYADRLRRNIAACTIRSPNTGEIIYANEGRIRNEIVEGERVRNRQEVVRIPNLDVLEVDIRIHESQMAGVNEGLPATVTLDAYPGRLFQGHIATLSQVPTAGSYYTRDLKEYDAAVRIDAPPEQIADLMPGLTAQVEIHLARRDDCLSIPPQSVVDVLGRNIVFVDTETGVQPREVALGLMAVTGAEVISGLAEHEQVVLSPRTTCGELIVALREAFSSETRAANIGG